MKTILPLIAGLALLVGIIVWASQDRPVKSSQTSQAEVVAQCLADQGVTMYGAAWCPHCQNEKRAFGEAFKLIHYVECPEEPNKCLAAGITGYPTWIWPDGRRLEGEQGLAKLAAAGNCSVSTP